MITVDIKSSTSLGGRQRKIVQKSVFDVIEKLKTRFDRYILSVGMTAGDEFQIVVNFPEKSIDIIAFIQQSLPARFYAGVGVGSIESVSGKLSPAEMYGTAFYRSRDALNQAKKRKVDVVFSVGDESLDLEVNTLIELALFVRGKWTGRQREVLDYIESHEGLTQAQIAKHFEVSKQAISKIMRTSGFESLRRGKRLVATLLANLREK